jgi:hypothetical protein
MKFLFRMENVGQRMWDKRKEVVNKYFEVVTTPFVRKSTIGYSVSDFEMMKMELEEKGYKW